MAGDRTDLRVFVDANILVAGSVWPRWPYLAAIEAGADCLVSEDKDLTVRDESTAELRRLLPVYLSGTFLREMMGWSTEQLERVRGRTWQNL